MAGKILGQPKYAKVRERWCEVETLIIDEGTSYHELRL